MTRIVPLILIAAVLFLTAKPPLATADDAEGTARHRHQQAIEALGQSSGDEALQQFAGDHLAPDYRQSFAPGKLMELLRAIRAAAADAGGVLFGRDGEISRVRFVNPGGETPIAFRMQASDPYLITALEIEATAPPRAQVDPITWETLDVRMAEEAKAGFSGSLLVVRGGKIVLHQGYGFSDREKQTPNTENTIFAIGSTPIDFTHAAVLKLEDMRKLKTSDPITKYLENVPVDKQAITLDHLMSGGSGLADFHHIFGVDADPDLTWIDRDTAVKRILGGKLRFVPGSEREHSHSAWVLLAAIVEIASGQSYGDFTREHLFTPAGMTHTGLHEDLERVDDGQIAVGYEAGRAGKINSPKYWGRTSWLVMGSGGMESTPGDLHRFVTAVRGAKILSAASATKYGPGGGVMVGGDDRGFLCMHTQTSGDMFFLCSNVHRGPGDHASAVGRRLAEMVRGKP